MTDHKVKLGDAVNGNEKLGGVAPTTPRKQYVVTTESGLFKGGKTYEKGAKVELDQATAERFKELGEIKNA